MIVRAIDNNGDWQFGAGLSNYISANAEISQDIVTNLRCFLGNCFFDTARGIDWLTFCSGSRSGLLLKLAIQTTILNTNGVTGILQLNFNLNHVTRQFSFSAQVQTQYSTVNTSFVYDLGVVSGS